MRINDPQVKKVLNEEVQLFLNNQYFLAEHKKLVAEKKDFHSQAALFLIEDLTGKPVNPELLDEGLWEKAKHMISKLGHMTSGRRRGGKKYKAALAALSKVENALDKAAADKVKQLKAKVEETHPEFPNNPQHQEFLNGLFVVAETYDSIVADAEASGDPAAIKEANIMIERLRALVKFYLDNELSTSYTVVTEEQQQWLEEAKVGSTAARGGTAVGRMASDVPPTGASAPDIDPGTGYTKRGTKGTETTGGYAADAETIKMLKSKLLPALLVGAGGLAGILAHAPWFVQTVQGVAQNPTPSTVQAATQKITNTLTFDRKTPGVTQALGGFLHGDANHFGPDTPMSEILGALEKAGMDPESPGNLFANATNPSAMASSWASRIAAMGGNASGTSAAQFFGQEGTDLARSFWMEPGAIVRKITTKLAKVGAKKVAKGAAAAAATAVGVAANPVLLALGIASAAAGGAMMLLRMKGRKSSRAAMLSDLMNEMTPIPGEEEGEGPTPPGPEKCPDDQQWDEEAGKCVPKVGPDTPPPGKPPAPNVTRLGLAKLDDDGVDIYIGTRRNKAERQKELDMMKQAQDVAPVGSDSAPTSREIDTALQQLRRKPDADTVDYDDLQKFVKGRSKKEPEVFITVDASIRQHVAQALKAVGAIKRAAVTKKIKAAVDNAAEKMVDKFAASKKKQTPRQARIIAARELKKAGIENLEFDDFKGIIKVFQDYGLVRPGELTPGRKRKKKGAEKPLPPTGNPPPPRRTLQESKQLDRWKLLANIK